MRKITVPLSIDFMSVSSYGDGTVSTGRVRIIKDLDKDVSGMDILIVEDILDSGYTLENLTEMIKRRKPNSVKICTLFDKPERRKADISADYVGAHVPDEFIVGYGLDYAQKYRNLPYVGVLKKEIYTK
jgi:hypoxanthine phosphoribosyltransferase